MQRSFSLQCDRSLPLIFDLRDRRDVPADGSTRREFESALRWKLPVNLKQLSDMLALSQTTVSRALNGYPEVNEETRRRVHGRRQAARLPAEPERPPAGDRQGRHDRLCHADGRQRSTSTRISSSSCPGLGDYARAHDLDLVLSPTDADDEETTYRRVVANKQVDAVYVSVAAPRGPPHHAAQAARHSLSSCMAAREGLDFDYPYLDIDNEGAFHEAARLLDPARPPPDRADQRRRQRRPSPSSASGACAARLRERG